MRKWSLSRNKDKRKEKMIIRSCWDSSTKTRMWWDTENKTRDEIRMKTKMTADSYCCMRERSNMTTRRRYARYMPKSKNQRSTCHTWHQWRWLLVLVVDKWSYYADKSSIRYFMLYDQQVWPSMGGYMLCVRIQMWYYAYKNSYYSIGTTHP